MGVSSKPLAITDGDEKDEIDHQDVDPSFIEISVYLDKNLAARLWQEVEPNDDMESLGEDFDAAQLEKKWKVSPVEHWYIACSFRRAWSTNIVKPYDFTRRREAKLLEELGKTLRAPQPNIGCCIVFHSDSCHCMPTPVHL